MIASVMGVIHFIQPDSKNFSGFFACFMLLFTTTGIANGSVFRMIGVIFPPKEKAPVLGFSAAIAASTVHLYYQNVLAGQLRQQVQLILLSGVSSHTM